MSAGVHGAVTVAGPRYYFHVGRYDEACELVKRHHYSRRVPSNVQVVGTMHEDGGLFGDYGPAVAACFFSIPPTRWREPVLELSRLVRTETHLPLTPLIAATCRMARDAGADLLVSFADATQGHHGGIYQAASWAYAGRRNRRIDGILLNGQFINCRQCRHLFGTSLSTEAVIEREKHKINGDVEPHYDEGKHIYWRALTREGKRRAARLGLASLPYPKPQMQRAAE